MRKDVRIYICNRCGRTEFCNRIALFTDRTVYENPRKGWVTTTDRKDLCPHCAAVYDFKLLKMEQEFYGEDQGEED